MTKKMEELKVNLNNETKFVRELTRDYDKLKKNKEVWNEKFKTNQEKLKDAIQEAREIKEAKAILAKAHLAEIARLRAEFKFSTEAKSLSHEKEIIKLKLELKEQQMDQEANSGKIESLEKQLVETKKEKSDLYGKFTNLAFMKEKANVNLKALSDRMSMKNAEREEKQLLNRDTLLLAKKRRDTFVKKRKQRKKNKHKYYDSSSSSSSDSSSNESYSSTSSDQRKKKRMKRRKFSKKGKQHKKCTIKKEPSDLNSESVVDLSKNESNESRE
jgi:hypothetical protein